MAYAGTYTETFSVLDIRHVLSRFEADLLMLARATTCLSELEVRDYVHDLRILAEHKFLRSVDVTLLDASGRELQARTYTVATDAQDWSSDLPGGNVWPRTSGGHLDVVVSYTESWKSLSAVQRTDFRTQNGFRINWVPAMRDLTHAGLTAGPVRRYARNGYGLERRDYR